MIEYKTAEPEIQTPRRSSVGVRNTIYGITAAGLVLVSAALYRISHNEVTSDPVTEVKENDAPIDFSSLPDDTPLIGKKVRLRVPQDCEDYSKQGEIVFCIEKFDVRGGIRILNRPAGAQTFELDSETIEGQTPFEIAQVRKRGRGIVIGVNKVTLVGSGKCFLHEENFWILLSKLSLDRAEKIDHDIMYTVEELSGFTLPPEQYKKSSLRFQVAAQKPIFTAQNGGETLP